MKLKNVFLIFIIGLMSINLVFAGSYKQNYRISGDLEISNNLNSVCIAGSGNWVEGTFYADYCSDPATCGGSQTAQFSLKNFIDTLFFAPAGGCMIEIYSPNNPNHIIYENKGSGNKGLTAEAIKIGLQNGISVGPIEPNSESKVLNFKVRIRNNNSAATELLTTTVAVPNPNYKDNVITSDYLKNLDNTENCNQHTVGKIGILNKELSQCVQTKDDVNPNQFIYYWVKLNSQTQYIGNFTNLLKKFDSSVFYPILKNNKLNITLKKINTDMIEDDAVTIDKLSNDLRSVIGEKVTASNVDLVTSHNDYIRVKGNDGDWYYIKLYPADSFINFSPKQNLCPTIVTEELIKIPINSYRIPISGIEVSPVGIQGWPQTHVIHYTQGNDYFELAIAGPPVGQPGPLYFDVTVKGKDDANIEKSYKGTFSALRANDTRCKPPASEDDLGNPNYNEN